MTGPGSGARILVVGAGLAGLSCARTLLRSGLSPLVLEASRRPGGRVVTDEVDGFFLDRGFQVLLAAYPELDPTDRDALDLRPFEPGALVRSRGRFRPTFHPLRRPARILPTLAGSVFLPTDFIGLARLRLGALDRPSETDLSAAGLLARLGLSERARREFFRPFFGGVLLDTELGVPAAWLRFLIRMFATAPACLPAGGMGAIGRRMEATLPRGTVHYEAPVRRVAAGEVELDGGEILGADAVVVATDGATASRLVPDVSPEVAWRGTTTLYFATEAPPFREPVLVLDGDGHGPALHMTVPSNVSRSYAPSGWHLVSASVPGARRDPLLEDRVRAQLGSWFGPAVRSWRHLRSYAIERALPVYRPGFRPRGPRAGSGVFVCGDHVDTPSINGALASGRLAAARAIASLSSEAA